MKITIWEDERYPDYGISTTDYNTEYFDVDARKVKRWKKVIKEYKKVQNEIEAIYNK